MKVCQASISEKGTIDGKAGNQSGRELNESTLKTLNWQYALRFKNPTLRTALAFIIKVAVNNKNIGYSQKSRNTIWTMAKKYMAVGKIAEKCNCDCSSLVSVCVLLAYYSAFQKWLFVPGKNLPSTRSLRKTLMDTGVFEVYSLPRLSNLEVGDILLNEGKHTCVVTEVDHD